MNLRALDGVRLEGPTLGLRALNADELPALALALVDPAGFYATMYGFSTAADTEERLRQQWKAHARGDAFAWVAERSGGEPVACSSFLHPSDEGPRVEIGFTWIAKPWQGRGVNPEMKFLQLRAAFGLLGARRVEFMVSPSNPRSNAAMKKLGAHWEGTLRNYRARLPHDAGDRHVYSILDTEWPEVSRRLEERMRAPL